MNIIFLDIDGPLCNHRVHVAVTRRAGLHSYFDPIACGLIKRLCEDYDCKIVIGSVWRMHYDLHAMQSIMNAASPEFGEYLLADTEFWRTKVLQDRKEEISEWISAASARGDLTNSDKFIIIDDESFVDTPLGKVATKCDPLNGFLFSNYIECQEMLK